MKTITLLYDRSAGLWRYNAAGVSVADDELFGGCYAGMDIGKNNVAMQDVHNVGPLPAGVYTIGLLQLVRLPHPLGPAMKLTQDPANQMFGRDYFWIHLDNPAHVGMSSDGCIVAGNDASMTGIAKLQKLNAMVARGENLVRVV